MVVERLPMEAELSMTVVSWMVVLTATLLRVARTTVVVPMVVPVAFRLVRPAPSRRYCAQ